jgi:hypothetical protein
MNSALRFWLGWSAGLALVLALLVWGLLQWNLANYSQLVGDRLLLLAELRRGAVQQYLSTADAELRFWSTSQDMLVAQASLIQLWDGDATAGQVRQSYVEGNPSPAGFHLNLDKAEDGSAYSEFHGLMHARAKRRRSGNLYGDGDAR